MELIVWRDTPSTPASSPWDIPFNVRSSRTRLFTMSSRGPLEHDHDLALCALPHAGSCETAHDSPTLGRVAIQRALETLGIERPRETGVALSQDLVLHCCPPNQGTRADPPRQPDGSPKWDQPA